MKKNEKNMEKTEVINAPNKKKLGKDLPNANIKNANNLVKRHDKDNSYSDGTSQKTIHTKQSNHTHQDTNNTNNNSSSLTKNREKERVSLIDDNSEINHDIKKKKAKIIDDYEEVDISEEENGNHKHDFLRKKKKNDFDSKNYVKDYKEPRDRRGRHSHRRVAIKSKEKIDLRNSIEKSSKKKKLGRPRKYPKENELEKNSKYDKYRSSSKRRVENSESEDEQDEESSNEDLSLKEKEKKYKSKKDYNKIKYKSKEKETKDKKTYKKHKKTDVESENSEENKSDSESEIVSYIKTKPSSKSKKEKNIEKENNYKRKYVKKSKEISYIGKEKNKEKDKDEESEKIKRHSSRYRTTNSDSLVYDFVNSSRQLSYSDSIVRVSIPNKNAHKFGIFEINSDIDTISFKILKFEKWIAIGMVDREKVVNNKYKFLTQKEQKPSIYKQHGFFGISSNGYTWNSNESDQDNQQIKEFNLEIDDEIVMRYYKKNKSIEFEFFGKKEKILLTKVSNGEILQPAVILLDYNDSVAVTAVSKTK